MQNIIDTLSERGFLSQCTHQEELKERASHESLTLYLGIDPTFHSLHIGHLTPVFMMRHFLNAGHCVIPLMGGGTGRIGDPSGKTEMRKLLSYEDIDQNVEAIKNQLKGLLDFNSPSVIVENNASWLADLNYIDFLRDIGSYFSVNKMLSYESYKKRLETGLSFLEFNYILLQSYDFYMLYKKHHNLLQIGGDDQWGNITSGVDLIRRLGGEQAYGLTCPLITRADGKKMGKSEKGAIFLDAALTTPYEMFQYWRNVDDRDVKKFLLLYTFLPVEEINELTNVEGSALNQSKERLAYEYVKLIHGEEEAEKAQDAAKTLFAGAANLEAIPTVEVHRDLSDKPLPLIDLYVHSGLTASKSEARRLIKQGGAAINNQKITDENFEVTSALLDDDQALILQAGKKNFRRIVFEA